MFGDLFGAFDGDQKADAVEPLASPPDAAAAAASASSASAGASKRKPQGQEEEEGPADGGGKKRARTSTSSAAGGGGGDGEEGEGKEQQAEAAAKGAQPTITQHQEIVTPDGRKVISFSALPADYVAPDVSVWVCVGLGVWGLWSA